MQDWTPTSKVTAGGITGAAIFLAILFVNQYVPFFHANPLDGPLASGLPFLGAMIASWVTTPSRSDVAVVQPASGIPPA